MKEGIVLGSVTSSIKHPSLNGKKLLVVQLLDKKDNSKGLPEVIVDCAGAGKGDRVLVSHDGRYMSERNNDSKIPIRGWLGGIIDEILDTNRNRTNTP